MADTFFEIELDAVGEVFRPTDACRGPWSIDACHAGPPSGLLARASERLLPDQQLVRLTVELTKPIPHAGFRVEGEVTRRGRTVGATRLSLVALDGSEVVRATAMHITPQPTAPLPTTAYDTPSLDEARPDRFPIPPAAHGAPMFDSGVEVRYPPGEAPEPGPTRMWMRALPLLPGESPSGFQRICPLADCGNAVSRNADPGDLAFMNTDLTVAVHRLPVGEWFGIDAVSRWEPNGLGISDSLLFDERGPVGRAVQSLLIQVRRPPAPAGPAPT